MTTEDDDTEIAAPKGERIAKTLARVGLCSRRDAERWVTEGRVSVDGTILTSPAFNVTETSIILVDGNPLPERQPTRLWRYHKPSGLVTSHRDEKGRDTLFQHLPPELGRVISVGRLDLNSEGLLLLTNDGDLARKLELPATGWVRRYKVRIHGIPDPARLATLEKGVTIEGVRYGSIKVEIERQQGANAWLILSLTEGKNREVRRVMEYLGYSVNRLIRLSYGPFQLGTLERGAVEEISRKVLREQMGNPAPSQTSIKNAAKAAAKSHRPKSAGPARLRDEKSAEAPAAKTRRPTLTLPGQGPRKHADRRRPPSRS